MARNKYPEETVNLDPETAGRLLWKRGMSGLLSKISSIIWEDSAKALFITILSQKRKSSLL